MPEKIEKFKKAYKDSSNICLPSDEELVPDPPEVLDSGITFPFLDKAAGELAKEIDEEIKRLHILESGGIATFEPWEAEPTVGTTFAEHLPSFLTHIEKIVSEFGYGPQEHIVLSSVIHVGSATAHFIRALPHRLDEQNNVLLDLHDGSTWKVLVWPDSKETSLLVHQIYKTGGSYRASSGISARSLQDPAKKDTTFVRAPTAARPRREAYSITSMGAPIWDEEIQPCPYSGGYREGKPVRGEEIQP
jgi:hypothetical protein